MKPYTSYKDSGIPWLGQIPEHWETKKISELFTERREKVSDKDYPALSVSKAGITPQLETAVKTDDGDNRKKVCEGDFVVNSRSDRKGSCGISPYTGSVSLINTVLQPRTDLNRTYMHYLFRSNDYIEEYYRLGRGIVADLWTTRYSEAKNIYIPFPPLAEQQRIVRFIDSKSNQIDAIINERKKQLTSLSELQQIIITNAITRGLNSDTPMRDCQSLLSLESPKHWELKRNKSFMSETGEKVGDRASEYTLLSLTTRGVIVRDIESGKGKFPSNFEDYQIVRPNELVFCLFDIDETPRTVGIVETEGMITGAYTALTVNENIALTKFIYYYYLCVDYIKGLKPYYSGLRKTVRADKFLQLYIPLPPIEEQRAIVNHIENKSEQIKTTIAKIEEEIAYLKEYKQRLIADAVTGAINVQE